MSQSIFLQSFAGKNKTIPVWFMRQAGRFLPEYRVIKEKHSLEDMFRTPELVAKVTCLPVSILGVDAAVLFADILTLPAHVGFKIEFSNTHGPIIRNPIRNAANKNLISDFKDVPYLRKSIQLINQKLPSSVPLIGFAGAPFTVLCYLVEGGSSTSFAKTLHLAFNEPIHYHRLMTRLTLNTIKYLNMQKDAGVKAFQLFDTWAGILGATDYERLVLPYVKKIFADVALPSIYYLKNCHHLLRYMEFSQAKFLSVCNTANLEDEFFQKTEKGIQGNLHNAMLYADQGTIKQEVLRILRASQKIKKYIFNLSHGLFPDTPVDNVKYVVDLVHKFKK